VLLHKATAMTVDLAIGTTAAYRHIRATILHSLTWTAAGHGQSGQGAGIRTPGAPSNRGTTPKQGPTALTAKNQDARKGFSAGVKVI